MGISTTAPLTGKPTYTDTSTTQADLQAAADYAEKVGNYVAGLASSRPATARDGWLYYETDTGLLWQMKGTTWKLILGDTGWSALTITGSGWSSSADGTYAAGKVRTKNGRVLLRGIFSKTSWAAFDTITVIDSALRPTDAVTLKCRIGAGTPGTARVLANGNFQVEEAGSGFLVIDDGYELL